MRSLSIRPFTPEEACEAAAWAYEPPFDVYSGEAADAEMFLNLSDDGLGYYAVIDDEQGGELVGFCCFGPEARVKGQADEPATLDIGGGVRPDLVSQGIATAVFPAVLEFAMEHFRPELFRTAVASFNERSLRLCVAAGFQVVRVFEGPGREVQELTRPARR